MKSSSVGIRRVFVISISMFAVALSGRAVQGADNKKPQLCQGNYHSEQAAKEQLAKFAGSYSNLTEWKTRAERIREGILRGAELLPMPKKCALNPIIHSKRRYKYYTVENVAFESLPGVFVTGNLYRPRQGKGPFAAVLCPHGHFSSAGNYGRFRPNMQKRCATLARMGAIVFLMIWWDMVTGKMQAGSTVGQRPLNYSSGTASEPLIFLPR